jgi:hypothetical protein
MEKEWQGIKSTKMIMSFEIWDSLKIQRKHFIRCPPFDDLTVWLAGCGGFPTTSNAKWKRPPVKRNCASSCFVFQRLLAWLD